MDSGAVDACGTATAIAIHLTVNVENTTAAAIHYNMHKNVKLASS